MCGNRLRGWGVRRELRICRGEIWVQGSVGLVQGTAFIVSNCGKQNDRFCLQSDLDCYF